jgi:WD40 repeat protein
VNWVSFSPDARLLVTASVDGTGRLWEVPSGAVHSTALRHRAGVNIARFSPSGQRLVTGSADGFARVWDTASGRPLSPPLQVGNSVTVAEFLDERRLLLGDYGGAARIWDAEFNVLCTGSLERNLTYAAVSPDKTCIVTANLNRERHLHRVGEELCPTGVLCDLAALQSCQRLGSEGRGLETLTPDELQTLWDRLSGENSSKRAGR